VVSAADPPRSLISVRNLVKVSNIDFFKKSVHLVKLPLFTTFILENENQKDFVVSNSMFLYRRDRRFYHIL
jgi:hypothetical protein